MSLEAESMVLCVGSNSIWMFPKINRGTPKWMVYNGKPY